jgi:hypothetical protein
MDEKTMASRLADWVIELDFDQLPPRAIEVARLLVPAGTRYTRRPGRASFGIRCVSDLGKWTVNMAARAGSEIASGVASASTAGAHCGTSPAATQAANAKPHPVPATER